MRGSIAFGKIAGDKVRGNVVLAYKSPGFDVNELGFMRRADAIQQRFWVQRRWNDAGKYVRTKMTQLQHWRLQNFGGDPLDVGGNVNSHWTFTTTGPPGAASTSTRDVRRRLTRGGPGGYRNPNMNGWFYFNTDNSRVVSFHWDSNFFVDRPGGSGGEGVPATSSCTRASSSGRVVALGRIRHVAGARHRRLAVDARTWKRPMALTTCSGGSSRPRRPLPYG
jgi:hypothetical protein